jgi:multidrug efflux pump subunit AcrB
LASRQLSIIARITAGKSSAAAILAMEGVMAPGFSDEWTGTALQEKEASGQTTSILVLAMLFAYLFLVARYRVG